MVTVVVWAAARSAALEKIGIRSISNVVDVSKTDIAMPCVLEGMQTGISISYQPD